MLIRPFVVTNYENFDNELSIQKSKIDLVYNCSVLNRREDVIRNVFDFNPKLYEEESVIFLFSFLQEGSPSIHIPMPVAKINIGEEDIVGILNYFNREIKKQSPLLSNLEIFITVSFSVSVRDFELEDLESVNILSNIDSTVSSIHSIHVGNAVTSYLSNHEANDSRKPINQIKNIEWEFDEYEHDSLGLSDAIVTVSQAYFGILKQCEFEHTSDLSYSLGEIH